MRTVLAAFLLASAAGWAVHARITQPAKLDSVLSVSEFVHHWQVSKPFTLNVANAMPAEFYSFKPNAEEMSFGEQIIHIAGAPCFGFSRSPELSPRSSLTLPIRLPATRQPRRSCSSNPSIMSSPCCHRFRQSSFSGPGTFPPGRAATIQTAGR
jgi:hypothetical protein